MSGPWSAAASILIPGALAVFIAAVLLRRGRLGLGLIGGVGTILAAQVVMQWRLWAQTAACVKRACRLISNAAACDAAAFGCREWTGLAAMAYAIAAAIDLAVVLAVVFVAARIRRRRTGLPSTG